MSLAATAGELKRLDGNSSLENNLHGPESELALKKVTSGMDKYVEMIKDWRCSR